MRRESKAMADEINIQTEYVKENANTFTNMAETINIINGRTLIDNLKKSGEVYNEYFNLISYIDVLFGVCKGLFRTTSSFLTKTGIKWDEVEQVLAKEVHSLEEN